MKTFLYLCLLSLVAMPLKAADYYWIGGTGDWSDISNWATTSGGFVTQNQAPTAEDNVFFDANSFTAPGQTVTLNGDIAFCRDMIWQAGTQNAVFSAAASASLNVFGSFQLSTEMVFDFQGDVLFQGSNTGNTINLAGQQFNRNLTFDGVGASWQLDAAVTVDSLFLFYSGQLNSASFPITAERFYSSVTSNGSNLNLENSVFTLTGIDLELFLQNPYTFYLGGNAPDAYTFDQASFILNGSQTTALFEYSNPIDIGRFAFLSETGESVLRSQINFALVFRALEFQNNGSIETPIEADSLILGGGKGFDFAAGQEYAIGVLDIQGNCQEPVFIQSASSGEPIFFRSTGAGLTAEYATLRDIHTRGNGPFTANNSVDLGNNAGWTINTKSYTELYWVGGSGMWDDSDHWSFTSGGPGGACIPTPGEDVIFDANSFSGVMDMVMINVENAYCRDMRWENPTGNPSLNGIRENNIRIFGSLGLTPAMDFDFQGDLFFETKDPNQTITTANHLFSEDVTFNGTGGWVLQDSLKMLKDLNFLSGDLNTNDQNIKIRRFEGNVSTQRTLNLTDSYIELNDTIEYQYLWFEIGTDNLNLDAGTSTINFRHGGNLGITGNNAADFHKVIHSSGGSQNNYTNRDQNVLLGIDTLILFAWNNTNGHVYPKHIVMYPGYIFTIQRQDTLSFDSIVVVGGCGDFVEMRSSETNTASFVNPSKPNMVRDLIVKDLHNNTGFSLDVVSGVDLGNNIGWTFLENAGRDLYWVNDGGEWRDSIHWSLTSGGPGGECPPGPNDNVYFDANSFANTNQFVNATPVTYCKNMDWTGATGVPRFFFFEHQNFGSLTFIDNMIVDASTMRYRTDSMNVSIDTRGKYFWRGMFDGGGSWVLQDSFDVYNFDFVSGDLITNSASMNTRRTTFYSQNKKTLDMRGSHWYHTGEANRFEEWYVENNTMQEVLAEGSTVELTSLNPIMYIYDHFTFDHLLSSNTAANTSFNMFNDQADSIRFSVLELRNSTVFGGSMYGDTILLSAGKTFELDPDAVLRGEEYIQMFGNNCTPIELKSKVGGQQADLVTDMGVVKADFVQMQDIRAVGNIDFYAGIRSTDIANNSNWIFDSAEEFVDEGFLGQDKVLCDASTLTLDANNFSPDETYTWQDGSTDSIFVTDQPGLFFVEVMFTNNCSIRDSVRVLPQQDFQPNLPDTTSILCVGDTLLLDADLDLVGLKYLWQDSSTASSFVVRGPGAYKVSLEIGGCTSADSTMVREVEYPVFSLGNDLSLCADSTFLLDATTDTATYRWSDGTTDATLLVSSPGTIWADVSYEQCTTRDSIEVAYFAPVPLNLGPDVTICEGNNLTITGSVSGADYTWSDGSMDTVLVVDMAGAYSVEAVLNGCPAYDTINVAVQELPRFELGPDTAICAGESIVLDGNSLPGTTYEWSDGSMNSTLAVSTAGTFALQATLNNCTFVDTRVLTVKPLPLVDLGQDQILCEEETTTLEVGQTNAAYLWQDGSTASSFVVNSAGDYSVAVTLEGCVDSDTVNFVFNPLPRFELGPDETICEGESTTFDGTSLPGTVYEWSDGSTMATLDANTTGLYALQATLNSCTFSDIINLTVNPLPLVDLGADQVLCEEETFTLDVTQTDAIYLWQDGSSNGTFTVAQGGDYGVIVDLNGCRQSDTINFIFNPLPRFDLGADTSICAGESVTFDGTSLAGASYEWNDGSTQATLTTSDGGLYSLQATLDGCVFTDTRNLRIKLLPIVDFGADQVLCEEETFTLDVTQADASYNWQDGTIASTYTVAQTGDYSVDVNLEGCVVSDTINFTFNPIPRFDLGADTLLCEGENLLLDGSVDPNTTYAWNDGTLSPTLTVSNPGTYTLTAALNSCTFSDEIVVNYGIIPADLLGMDQIRCEEEVINFNLNVPNATYSWMTGTTSPDFSISQAGTYGVQVNIGRCVGGDTINVSYNPLPRFNLGNDTLLCEGEQLALNIDVLADSYQWQDGSTNTNFQVSFPGTYQATATLDGCTFTDAINVDFQVNRTFSLGPDTTICADVPITLAINQPADQILWQDGSTGRTLTASEAGTYTVEVIDGACSFSDEIIIGTRDCFRFRMFRPSAFSPNSDGVNDEFLVEVPPNTIIESFDMNIYDRWGNLLFTSGDINTGWNGLIQDQPADSGVYIYSIKIKYQDDFRMDEEIISGDVLLIR